MGEPMRYLPRVIDERVRFKLCSSGALLIEGPKWCGKTSTAIQHSQSQLFLQDPDRQAGYLLAADSAPSTLLAGETPRLLDEWQVAPVLWNAVRVAVDQRQATGQFILTGSAVPHDDPRLHTGTGRIARLRMRTMSLAESGDSSAEVSLGRLFDHGGEVACATPRSVPDLARLIARGGWPESVGQEQDVAEDRVRNYVDAVVHSDVSRVDGISRDPQLVTALLRTLARNTASEATVATLGRDLAVSDATASTKTVSEYLVALQRIHVVENQPAWNPSLRSKTPLRTSPKRHFTDPSIALAALGVSAERLLADFETFGLLFESLCIRDLRVYAESLGGSVFHYRDKSNLECDAVVVLPDGRWGAVEVKMGASQIETAAEHLLALERRVDTDRMSAPSFRMVLTAQAVGYTRADGTHVLPLACLGP